MNINYIYIDYFLLILFCNYMHKNVEYVKILILNIIVHSY